MASGHSTRESIGEPASQRHRTLLVGTVLAATVTFLVSGALVIVADPPPSDAPVLGVLAHGLWALSVSLLAVGVLSAVWVLPALRRRLSGVLSVGALGLGVVVGIQWLTWAYVDVRAAEQADYELALATVITPFGAGHVLMYAILLGAGIAWFAWALVAATVVGRVTGSVGVVVGVLTAAVAAVSLLAALEGGGDGHWLYNVATILLPVCYLWAGFVAVQLYRDWESAVQRGWDSIGDVG